MISSKVKLKPLCTSDVEKFIKDNQEAFKYGALEEFGLRDDHFEEDGEIISRATIETAIKEGEAHIITVNNNAVGGCVVKTEGDTGYLELIFINPAKHSKGFGYRAWFLIENRYKNVKKWITFTPCFEKRNINFYVNKCGFYITEIFSEEGDFDMFRFEKVIK